MVALKLCNMESQCVYLLIIHFLNSSLNLDIVEYRRTYKGVLFHM